MKRLRLCHGPTPIWRNDRLDQLLGMRVWVKRDDMTSGAAAGNKIRKLEYLLSDALAQGATTLITCGGAQSNHARATAILGRELGLDALLFLRVPEPQAVPPPSGNLLLNRLVGAELRFITPAQYRERGQLMEDARHELARAGRTAYVIPEGGSNGLGALGYVSALQELEHQRSQGELPNGLEVLAFACGSGGTAAGIALGLGCYPRTVQRAAAIAVCDDRTYFERVINDMTREARKLDPGLAEPRAISVHDEFKGPAYGSASPGQLEFIRRVAGETGLLLEPTYTGKALFGLSRLSPRPASALFLHTGGRPGLLADDSLIAWASAHDASDS
jgi:D-cysteine desulfhydrase